MVLAPNLTAICLIDTHETTDLFDRQDPTVAKSMSLAAYAQQMRSGLLV